jgi:5-methylthioadenosine/S-adenosylhomocysteine deaminase
MEIEARRLGVGIHIHVLETRDERDEIRKLNDAEPFDILKESGILDGHLLAAHAAYLTSDEIKLVKDYPFVPVHCPGSNLKLASGIAPVWEYLQEEIVTGLGTDGAASNNNLDMFEEMRLAALIHKEDQFDPTVVSAYQALELATRGGAKAVGMENEIGQIKEGMKADIILVDMHKPHLTPMHNVIANLVYSASAADVSETIVGGRLLMENRKLLTIDEEEILQRASETAMDLINRT